MQAHVSMCSMLHRQGSRAHHEVLIAHSKVEEGYSAAEAPQHLPAVPVGQAGASLVHQEGYPAGHGGCGPGEWGKAVLPCQAGRSQQQAKGHALSQHDYATMSVDKVRQPVLRGLHLRRTSWWKVTCEHKMDVDRPDERKQQALAPGSSAQMARLNIACPPQGQWSTCCLGLRSRPTV